jgi:threonine synthase
MSDISLAIAQRSLGNPNLTYPLFPPLTQGCPQTSSDEAQYPLEIVFDEARLGLGWHAAD